MPTDIFTSEMEGNFRSRAAFVYLHKIEQIYHKISCAPACAELTSAQ